MATGGTSAGVVLSFSFLQGGMIEDFVDHTKYHICQFCHRIVSPEEGNKYNGVAHNECANKERRKVSYMEEND